MFLDGNHYLLLSFIILLLAMAPMYIRFERKRVDAREIVLIALLAAIAAVSRVPFAALPSIQPTSFVVIIAGLAFGCETGFMVGATAALVSNIFLGQGPWTPWQMFGWGMMGFSAGLLKDFWLMKRTFARLAFGFIWGFLFGWLMNGWFIFGMSSEELNWRVVMTAFASSFYFDMFHAISNVFFLALFATSWLKVLNRFKRKVSGVQRVVESQAVDK